MVRHLSQRIGPAVNWQSAVTCRATCLFFVDVVGHMSFLSDCCQSTDPICLLTWSFLHFSDSGLTEVTGHLEDKLTGGCTTWDKICACTLTFWSLERCCTVTVNICLILDIYMLSVGWFVIEVSNNLHGRGLNDLFIAADQCCSICTSELSCHFFVFWC